MEVVEVVLDQLMVHILNTQHNLVVQVVAVMVLTGQLVLDHPQLRMALTTPEAVVVEVETLVVNHPRVDLVEQEYW
tara:strand:- start:40 stop:267 length:228 start_codon:yes stop_codon:yes gene_type:complete